MSILIASIIITVIAIAYAILLKRKLAEVYFVSVISVVAILYLFGLMNFPGCLMYGIYLIIGVFVVGVGFIFYKLKNNFILLREIQLGKGILLYLFFLIMSLYVNYDSYFHAWDEFSHWGIVVKHMFTYNAFGTVDGSQLLFKSYLPGTAIIEYFFSRFSTNLIEYISYIAMSILYFTLMMPFLKNIFEKGFRVRNIVKLSLFVILPLTAGDFYNVLYVDSILGIVFAFTMIYYFVFNYGDDLYGTVTTNMLIFMLCITKDMGFLFSSGCIIIFVIDFLIFRRPQSRSDIVSKITKYTLPIIITGFVKVSWGAIIPANTWTIPKIGNIIDIFHGNILPYQYEVINNFKEALFNGMRYFTQELLLIPVCISFFILAICLIYYRYRGQFKRFVVFITVFALGIFLYQIVLLLAYMFSFSEYEGVRLASYSRYTGTYILAMLYILMGLFTEDINTLDLKWFKSVTLKKIMKSGIYAISCVALLFFVCINSYNNLNNIINVRDVYPTFFQLRSTQAVKKWESYFMGQKPYVITQGDTGYATLRLAYELYDPEIDTSAVYGSGAWSIGLEHYYPDLDDPWTRIWQPAEWKDYILSMGYKLLYVYNSDDKFKEIYGEFFIGGVQDDMVYNIVFDEQKNMQLIPVTETNAI